MERIQCYDEAITDFYRDKKINNSPLSSLDMYVHHFSKVCKNLKDVTILGDLSKKGGWQGNIPFRNEILYRGHIVVVTDAKLNIVYATQNIYTMNGYHPEEVIGKKPKMFQGEKTCSETSGRISMAIKKDSPFEETITNYRKNGSTYNCWIKGFPIFDKAGKVVNFVAFEKEVA